jgi:hypothetical protein
MNSTNLVHAITSFQAGQLDESRLACLFYGDKRATQIIRTNLLRTGLPINEDFESEIRQRAVLVVFEKLLAKINKPEGFYSLWYATVQRVTLEHRSELYRHDHFETPEDESFHEDQYALELADEGLDTENIVNSSMYEKQFSRLLEGNGKLMEIVGMYPAESREKTVLPIHDTMPLVESQVGTSMLSVHHNQRKDKHLSNDQKELVQIRETLDLTLKDYAKELDIQQDRLASYVYGKTRGVPEWVMENARTLLASGENDQKKLQGRFANKAMSEIVEGWKKSLGADNEKLALLLDVLPSSVDRWEKNETRPENRRLAEYDKKIESVAVFLSKS